MGALFWLAGTPFELVDAGPSGRGRENYDRALADPTTGPADFWLGLRQPSRRTPHQLSVSRRTPHLPTSNELRSAKPRRQKAPQLHWDGPLETPPTAATRV